MVLLFPPVNNYRRFLIHATCESFRQEYGLFTFSIGQGPWRRTIICFKNQLLDPTKYTTVVASNTEQRKESRVKSWRSDIKREPTNTAASAFSNTKKDLTSPKTMGVERNLCNNTSHAASTRCAKAPFLDIYRPPALRCQNNGSAVDATSVNAGKTSETVPSTPSNSVSCNNSPTHAVENKKCNTLNPPPNGNCVLLAQTSDHETQSSQNSPQQHTTISGVTTTASSRRERRPDRAVYIPRARRSQTTPPATTQAQTSATTANNVASEQHLPITTNTNGLVSTSPSSKADESTSKVSKKSRSSGVARERKERTKKRTISTSEQSEKNVAAAAALALRQESDKEHETKDTNSKGVKINSANSKRVERAEDTKNTRNKSLTSCKEDFSMPQKSVSEQNDAGRRITRKSSPNKAGLGSNHSIVHIEDVVAADPVPPKCDIEEQELQKASKEINRSNRRIMKQTFASDVLEIPETIDKVKNIDNLTTSTMKPRRVPATTPRSNIDTTTDEDEEEGGKDDSWESMFDESGECLDPKIIEELTASVGKVKIELPKMDYTAYLTKQTILNGEEFPHVLEVSNFPVEFRNQDLLMLFSQYKGSGFDIKWVDDTHALAIFSSSRIAAEVLTMGHPFVVVKPLGEATLESRLKAKKCAASLQPYRPRPETCAALARRLVTGALGVRLKTAAAERENEKRVLREAKERKLLAAKQRDEAWAS